MTVAESRQSRTIRDRITLNAIDTDIHQDLASPNELLPFLAAEWHPSVRGGLGFAARGWHNSGSGLMEDSIREEDGLCAADPDWVVDKLMDRYRIDLGILTGTMIGVGVQHSTRFLAALTRAYNDWVLERWVRPYDCFKGSILVTAQDPAEAAREIRRLGSEAGMVQVLMSSAARMPYGNRFYWPIYAAAQEYDLPVGIHVGAEGTGIANPPTSVGYPSTYLEFHSDHSQTMMGHCVSMLADGVFEEYGDLRFGFIEGGIVWAPHILGRMDRSYRALKAEVPWLTRLPSEYFLGRLFWSTQPIEEPPDGSDLIPLLEMMHADRTVIFASDYPHWDFDNPHTAFRHFPPELKRRVFVDNVIDYCGERVLRHHRP